MKRRVNINQLTEGKINQWAEDGDEFEAASMSGRPGNPGPWGAGRLDDDWAALLAEHGAAGDISYVIYSYATPIAWRTSRGWVIVTRTFSVTTGARHQPKVRYLRPTRADVWCPGIGREPRKTDKGRFCPDCDYVVPPRVRAVHSHLLLKKRVSA